jgi:hypothetical protein
MKEEYGLLCAVICCSQPHPVSFHLSTARVLRTRGIEESPPPPPLPLLDSLRLHRQISRTASNLEVVSMTADIGQHY